MEAGRASDGSLVPRVHASRGENSSPAKGGDHPDYGPEVAKVPWVFQHNTRCPSIVAGQSFIDSWDGEMLRSDCKRSDAGRMESAHQPAKLVSAHQLGALECANEIRGESLGHLKRCGWIDGHDPGDGGAESNSVLHCVESLEPYEAGG